MDIEKESIDYVLTSIEKDTNFTRLVSWIEQELSALLENNIIENEVSGYTEETYCECFKLYKPDYLSILQSIHSEVNMAVFLAFLDDEDNLTDDVRDKANEAFMKAVRDDLLDYIHNYFDHDDFNEYDLE